MYMFMLVALELPLVLQGSAMKMLGYTSIIGDIWYFSFPAILAAPIVYALPPLPDLSFPIHTTMHCAICSRSCPRCRYDIPPLTLCPSLVIGMSGVLADGFRTETIKPMSEYPMFEFASAGESFGSVAFLFCVNFLVIQYIILSLTPHLSVLFAAAAIHTIRTVYTCFAALPRGEDHRYWNYDVNEPVPHHSPLPLS